MAIHLFTYVKTDQELSVLSTKWKNPQSMDQQLALHQLPLEIRDKAMIVEELFLNYSKTLAVMGYTTKPTLHYLDSIMKQPHSKQIYYCHNRELVFIINYYDAEYEMADRLITTMHRLPYTDINDFIDLDRLLKKRNIPYNVSMFFARSYEGNIDKQFKTLFGNVMKLLLDNFFDILNGEDWEEGCYTTW